MVALVEETSPQQFLAQAELALNPATRLIKCRNKHMSPGQEKRKRCGIRELSTLEIHAVRELSCATIISSRCPLGQYRSCHVEMSIVRAPRSEIAAIKA